jgi:autotransporter-associated beta strand protein
MNARKLMALAAICVATASSTSWAADMTISTDYVLNDDLTVDGTLTVASGATVDLNGHKLSVKGLAGAGSIIDSNQSYELLDYIESTGAQHIDTDIIPGANTAVDVVATATAVNNNQTLFGAGWGTFYLCMAQGTTWYCLYNKKVVDSSLKGNRRRVVVGNGTATIYDGKTGAVIGTTQPSFSNTSGKVLSICGLSGNSYHGYWRIHSFKISHEGVMRFDFVPARERTTGHVGLLNQLNGRFYVSETDTEFIAGPVVGGLHVEAASEAALANFSGTIDSTVSMALDGECTLTANADWRRFTTLHIDGCVNLNGHELVLDGLPGSGTVTDQGDNILEYVEANGNQVVDTGIVSSTDTAVELDATYLTSGDGTALFGCDDWSANRYMFVFASGKLHFFGAGKNFGAPANGTRYIVSVTPSTSPNGKIKVVNKASGALLGSEQTDALASNNTELRLFGFGNNTRMGNWRLHSFKMWKGGDLKRDLVPMRKNGVAGLYDRVTGDFLVSNTDTDLIAGPVAADTANLGTLHVDVAEGRTVVADTLALSGSLALVKKGAGTLFMNRPGQTYMGGTCVAGGVLTTKSGGAQNVSVAGDAYFGKPGSRIMADVGGVFDFNGNSDYRIYNIVLNGGTLRNGGYDQAQNQGSLGHLTITTNSVIETAFNITVFNAATDLWNLGGYTLSVDTLGKTLYFRDSVVLTNGVFWLKGDGCWHVNAAVQARGVNLRAESALWLGAKLDVDDYYAACTFDSNNGTAAMNVYGRFTPATDYFYGCTLQDGATLDLNGRNGAWSTTSAFTSGANHVTFASGSTITVDVSTRPTFKGKIVDWGAGNTPSDVKFKLDAASKAMGRALRVKDDGLYAVGGVIIIIR